MSGKNPLGNSREPQSYEGLNVVVPVGGWTLIKSVRSPTSSDKKYPVGSIWVNTTNNTCWILTSAPGNWSEFAASVSGAITSITGDSGGAESAVLGNFNIKGTANQILVAGSAGTETLSLIGPYTPATYTAHGVLIGEGTSSIVATAAGTNGQVLLGSTGADPVFGTITTTTGISLSTGAGSLAIDIQNGGFAVVNQTTASATLAAQTKYITNDGANLVTYTLPATVAQGATIEIVGLSAGGWKIAQQAGQTILLNDQTTTAGTNGSVSSTSKNSCVKLVATDATTNVWVITASSGQLTFV